MIDYFLDILTSISICLIVILAITSIGFFGKEKNRDKLKELGKSKKKPTRTKKYIKTFVINAKHRMKIVKAQRSHRSFSKGRILSKPIDLRVSDIMAEHENNKNNE